MKRYFQESKDSPTFLFRALLEASPSYREWFAKALRENRVSAAEILDISPDLRKYLKNLSN